ncbi:MAG: helix-turn-helix domain-containing protein [Steroidobacteraceae bacterium]
MPGGALRRYVEEIRIVVRGDDESCFVGLPQIQARLILSLFDAGAGPARRALGTPGINVLAGRTSAVYKSVATSPASVVVRFRPGCAQPFFRVPMCELVDRVVPLEEVWAGEGVRLHETLAGADPAQWLQLIEAALQRRMRLLEVHPDSARAANAVMAMTRSRCEHGPHALAGELEVSGRHLRRIFNNAFGIPPKMLTRIVRFHRALREATQGETADWSSVAAAAGYYDQAHFIAECRGMTAMTPSNFLRTWRLTSNYREPLL